MIAHEVIHKKEQINVKSNDVSFPKACYRTLINIFVHTQNFIKFY